MKHIIPFNKDYQINESSHWIDNIFDEVEFDREDDIDH